MPVVYKIVGPGTPPGAPTQVTSIMKDSAATVSFYPPASAGSSSIASYTVTPYASGVAQAPTTVAVGSLGSISTGPGAPAATALQATVTGLTNGTAYTFTVKANNSVGSSAESAASGANTPLSKLVFGDDFNGSYLDPEWWVYDRCGYLAQSETEWYLPSQCVLDGAGNLQLIGKYSPYTGTAYPSTGGGTVTQPWISGACQNNTRSFAPSADGNTLTIETRFKVPSAVGAPYSTKGMWPGLLWMEGTDYQTAWKTDPNQATWNLTGKWELDLCEIGSNGQSSNPQYGSSSSALFNCDGGGGFTPSGGAGVSLGFDASVAYHVYSATWKGTSAQANRAVRWYTDAPYVAGTGPSGGTLVASLIGSSNIATQAYPIFMNLYLQILNNAGSDPGIGLQICSIDYVRVYDELI